MGGLIGYGLALMLMGSTGFLAGRGLRPRRDELVQTVAVLHNRMAQVEGGLGQVESDLKDLEDVEANSASNFSERLALLEERLKALITREEVQAAFAEVARATAAQQAAQAQQAQIQRQLQRQQEVFGARVPQAPAPTIPVPGRPNAGSTEQALNAQLEALNRRLAEIQSGQAA